MIFCLCFFPFGVLPCPAVVRFAARRDGLRSRCRQVADSYQVVDRRGEGEHPTHSFSSPGRVCRSNPTVFSHPNTSSTRLRFF